MTALLLLYIFILYSFISIFIYFYFTNIFVRFCSVPFLYYFCYILLHLTVRVQRDRKGGGKRQAVKGLSLDSNPGCYYKNLALIHGMCTTRWATGDPFAVFKYLFFLLDLMLTPTARETPWILYLISNIRMKHWSIIQPLNCFVVLEERLDIEERGLF